MENKQPKTTDGLMRHIRNNKKIEIKGSKQKRQLPDHIKMILLNMAIGLEK